MCGVAGFYKKGLDFFEKEKEWKNILDEMNVTQKHRGPDNSGRFIDRDCCLCHVRLSIIDPNKANQPMMRSFKGKKATIVYNGEIYNTKELRDELNQFGVEFKKPVII